LSPHGGAHCHRGTGPGVRENTLHIQRAVSYGEEKATKTNASRTVRLVDPLRRDLARNGGC
jgi:hypothetical protein